MHCISAQIVYRYKNPLFVISYFPTYFNLPRYICNEDAAHEGRHLFSYCDAIAKYLVAALFLPVSSTHNPFPALLYHFSYSYYRNFISINYLFPFSVFYFFKCRYIFTTICSSWISYCNRPILI